jgi:hypothetical protein
VGANVGEQALTSVGFRNLFRANLVNKDSGEFPSFVNGNSGFNRVVLEYFTKIVCECRVACTLCMQALFKNSKSDFEKTVSRHSHNTDPPFLIRESARAA